jgi:hypothetical protein
MINYLDGIDEWFFIYFRDSGGSPNNYIINLGHDLVDQYATF